MNQFIYRDDLKQRTKNFALRAINVYRALPNDIEAQIIGKQFLRSATSVAANYRAACRARSNSEFYSKISIVVEEADETMFWIELLYESNIIKQNLLQSLYNENEEILKIMIIARVNSQNKIKQNKINKINKRKQNNNSVIQ